MYSGKGDIQKPQTVLSQTFGSSDDKANSLPWKMIASHFGIMERGARIELIVVLIPTGYS